MAFEHILYIHSQGKDIENKIQSEFLQSDPEDLRDKLLVYQSILSTTTRHKTDPIWGIFPWIVIIRGKKHCPLNLPGKNMIYWSI